MDALKEVDRGGRTPLNGRSVVAGVRGTATLGALAGGRTAARQAFQDTNSSLGAAPRGCGRGNSCRAHSLPEYSGKQRNVLRI